MGRCMQDYPLLSTIHAPADLKKLTQDELTQLAEEIRHFLVEHVNRQGGHLASNLGVVELTLALHRVFDSPHDRIIWDVGHQSYVHKMLTGRLKEFAHLREPGGLSGFTRTDESEHDPFGAGHSSTALSAALGFATADALKGEDRTIIAVIGDGSFSGGMVHEALNNCSKNMRLIAILNENEMSIAHTTGAFAKYISKMRSTSSYYRIKRRTAKVLMHIPLLGKPLHGLLLRLKIALKHHIYGSNYYEDLGLFYMGPIDGHDTEALERALREAKRRKVSVLLHVKTKKGKGYAPAEEHPEAYHSVYPHKAEGQRFHEVFGRLFEDMAKEDPAVCAVVAAMGEGTGLDQYSKHFPERFFDVGIAEEHAVTFAAGLAKAGMKPYVVIYSTFFQRAYDQILHDVAMQNLPVRFVMDRAGLAVGDGPTHHGIFDVSFLSQCPDLPIFAPATMGSLAVALGKMAKHDSGPSALRYPNATTSSLVESAFYADGDYQSMGVKADFVSTDQPTAVIVTYGQSAKTALDAKASLGEKGVSVGVILIEQLTPYRDITQKLISLLPSEGPVVFLEEGAYQGGAGMHFEAELLRQMPKMAERYSILAIEKPFDSPKTPQNLYEFHHISSKDVENCVLALLH